MKTILLLVSVIIVLWLLFIFKRKSKRHELIDINKTRKKFTKTDFTNHLEVKGYNSDHISLIYDEITKHIGLKEFSLMPDDNIREICGFQDLDDIEFTDIICKKLRLNLPDHEDLNSMNEKHSNFTPEYLLDLTYHMMKKTIVNVPS